VKLLPKSYEALKYLTMKQEMINRTTEQF